MSGRKYIADGKWLDVPEEKKEFRKFFFWRFFSGLIQWFYPWIMISGAVLTIAKPLGVAASWYLAAVVFLSSFFIYHKLRKIKDGQGYFFVFSLVVLLMLGCFL